MPSQDAEVINLRPIAGGDKQKVWLDEETANLLFESILPSANLTDSDKKHWIEVFLKDYESLQTEKPYSANSPHSSRPSFLVTITRG